jgi:hypothetical protein
MANLGEVCERATDLYTIDHPLRLGGVELGTRTTLVRLSSGGLFVHAPGPLGGGVKGRIESLGRVEALVAPNLFHHFYIAENVSAWPQAELHLAPGLAEKVRRLPSGEVLGDTAPTLWASDLEQIVVSGMPRIGEIVFFHPKSKTLMITDLAFNMGAEGGFLARTMLKLMGAYDRFGPSRLARSFMKDKAALRESVGHILEWDFERITLTHGDIVEQDGHRLLATAYEEALGRT